MPIPSGEKQLPSVVFTSMNITSKEIISTNSSFSIPTSSTNMTSDLLQQPELEYWPAWIEKITCISHLSIAFNSSVNFFIYYMKRKALYSSRNNYIYFHINVLQIILYNI